MLDPQITEQVVAAWKADEQHPHRGRDPRVLPPPDTIKKFLDAAFFATIREEEGRVVPFAGVLVSEPEWKEVTQFPGRVHRLTTPIPFTPSSIPKLAPALDVNVSSLAVRIDEAAGQLMIWGIFSYDRPKHFFNELAYGVDGGALCRPDFFTASSAGPGSLVISRHDHMIGRLISGYFVAARPTPFAPASLGEYWDALERDGSLWRRFGRNFERFRYRAIETLLAESRQRCHGGTIVVMPSGRAPKSLVEGFVVGDRDFGFANRFSRYIGKQLEMEATRERNDHYFDHDTGGDLAYRLSILDSLQRLAQLAAVDGGLVIVADFNVLTFGAKLTAARWEGRSIVGPDGFGYADGTQFHIERYGTRHSSALNFVATEHGSIAFVLSHDGPIRAFTRINDSTVFCWPDCSTSMFVG